MEFWHDLSLFTKDNIFFPLLLLWTDLGLELIIFRLLSWSWNQIVLSTPASVVSIQRKTLPPVPFLLYFHL